MKKDASFIQAAHLDIQAAKMITDTLPLQKRIRRCNRELETLIRLQPNILQKNRIRELEDEIFGYSLELQAMQIRASRLVRLAKSKRFSGV
jgi:hypothetical protein